MASANEEALTPEVLARLAAQVGLPLTSERLAELAGRVRDTLLFTGELDRLDLGDVGPATVFIPLDG